MTEPDDTRHARGLATLVAIHGPAGDSLVRSLADVAPDFAHHLVAFPFGDIYSRPGLDLRARQIATIAALVTLGSAERQLKWHIRGGLNVGLTRDEVLEIIMQMAVYAGFPEAINAMTVAQEVFGEIAEAKDLADEAALQDDA